MRIASLLLTSALLSCGEPDRPSAVANGIDAAPTGPCVGPTPPKEAWSAKPGPVTGSAADAEVTDASDAAPGIAPAAIGSDAPLYALNDFQPTSCGFKATYGLPVFRGRVTVATLLAGWCGFCQSQAGMMEKMRVELEKAGVPVYFVAIHGADAIANQRELITRCSFPLLQDTDEVKAWSVHHHGVKDDIYVYDRNGKLADHLPFVGPRNINLLFTDGYDNLKNAILAAAKK